MGNKSSCSSPSKLLKSKIAATQRQKELKELKELKKLEGKWIRVKDELKVEMHHWLSEWREVAEDWIDKITISLHNRDGGTFLTINFPTHLTSSLKITIRQGIPWHNMVEFGSGVADVNRNLYVPELIRYCKAIPRLEEVPLNLLGEIIFRIAAFGGCKLTYQYSNDRDISDSLLQPFHNQLFYAKQHAFPGSNFDRLGYQEQKVDAGGWIKVDRLALIPGGNIFTLSEFHGKLFNNLSTHQCSRLVHLHFSNSSNSVDKLKLATELLARLKVKNHTSTFVEWDLYGNIIRPSIDFQGKIPNGPSKIYQSVPLFYLPGKTIEDRLNFNIADRNNPNNLWFKTIDAKDSTSVDLINLTTGLTLADIDNIFHIAVEVYLGNEQLHNQIVRSVYNDDKFSFPTANDHFNSFDEPELKGLLTTTSTARKLVMHTKSIQLLRQDASESIHSIPLAVVDLMQSYLTPLL